MTGPPEGRLRLADHYDAELRRHNERLRAATGIVPTDQVLDIGCGAGQTTCDAARAAVQGSALGVDVSDAMLERARRRTAEEGCPTSATSWATRRPIAFGRLTSTSSSAASARCSSAIRSPHSQTSPARRGPGRAW